MKRSKKATNHILIKAYTRSNLSTVEFAILKISPKWFDLANQRLVAIKDFKEGICIHSHSFWHSPLNFYKNPVDERLPDKILPKYEDLAFIILDPEEENTLPLVETGYGPHELIITKNGIAHFKAHGRYIGEVFLTEEFNLYKLIAKV